ncbi:MAG: hypothetical protein JXM69_19835, partial [Anaerolineae bacterium]|nr:hypothetical protein [Anaerolineae bacterium]
MVGQNLPYNSGFSYSYGFIGKKVINLAGNQGRRVVIQIKGAIVCDLTHSFARGGSIGLPKITPFRADFRPK